VHLVPEYRLANSGALGVKSTGSSAPCSRSSRGRARAAVIQAAKPGEAPGTRAARRPCRPGPSLPPPRRRAEMSLSHRLPPGAPAVDPYYVYAPRPDPHRQGVLTLFVAGLPDDVKPREIHNLFSHRPGFDHCLLEYTGRGNQAVAFVTFFTHEAALSAMTSLNGTIFDPDTGDRLHIELAKSTSRRPRGGGDVYRVIDKRANKPEGNADHENFGEEGWEEDESDGHDDDGQHYYLISL